MQHPVVAKAVAVQAAITELTASDLTGLAEGELLEVVRVAEQARRQLEAFDNQSIPELEARNLPGQHLARSTGAFLTDLLKLAPAEASARVRQARELGSQTSILAEKLPPRLPAVAAAREAGAITARHAQVIMDAVGALTSSDHITADQRGEAEAFLTEQAETFTPPVLARIARQLVDTLDPDGTLADENAQARRRSLSLTPLGDGMHRIIGDLDAETSALAMTVLHSLAAPKPDAAGDRDDRLPKQRLHDAVQSVLKLALRSGQLPKAGGVPATVLITMTADQFETGTGLAATSYGQKMTVPQALRLADEASVGWIVHDSKGAILNHGTQQRLATKAQTVALIARDRGCAFPGCTDPPEWSEKHHIIPWREGGRTDLNNLVLLCDHHHDRIETSDWQIIMCDGLPWFIPPAIHDPEQRPIRNIRP
ncbi:MAG: DUF222 domain-containing protein [Jatrophihabitantaceae bacterium]